jgi:hypothetical protein
MNTHLPRGICNFKEMFGNISSFDQARFLTSVYFGCGLVYKGGWEPSYHKNLRNRSKLLPMLTKDYFQFRSVSILWKVNVIPSYGVECISDNISTKPSFF